MGYILAFDCGTTAVKAVCIDMETNRLYSAKEDCRLFRPLPNFAEQDAQQMWDAICLAARQCVQSGGIQPCQIQGIVFSAPWKHIIPLDGQGYPLCHSMIWMDARAGRQAAALNQKMGAFVGTGQEYWPRLLWLKEECPDIWERAAHIVGINTYFKFRATGTLTTECSDDFIHTPNSALQQYYNRILACSGLQADLEKFPPSCRATDCVGSLTAQAAGEMHLTAGIPVFAGFSDLTAVSVGCGCVCEGQTHIYLGTSSWLAEIQRERLANYSNLYFTQDEEFETAAFTLQTGGQAYDWLIGQFYHAERQELGGGVYDLVNREVAQVPAGCEKLIATHWLTGELPPLAKNAKAVFFNISAHHDRRYFARAILESICYTHRWSLEKYQALHGSLPQQMTVVGGGAESDVWMQMMADILKVPVRVPPHPRYVGTMGAYCCAAVGLSLADHYSSVQTGTQGGRLFLPHKGQEAVYDEQFAIYKELYPALKSLYDRANGTV